MSHTILPLSLPHLSNEVPHEREFLAAALWTGTAALLSFFGLIHAYKLTPTGIQNRIGFNAAGTYALAYLGTAAILLALHYYHRGREVEKTGIVA